MKWWMLLVLLFVLATCGANVHRAQAHSNFRGVPLPYSCSQVRWAYATFTPEHLRKLGKSLGIKLSPSQMREASNCLKEGAR